MEDRLLKVHVLNTHSWLHRQLTTGQRLTRAQIVDAPEKAQIVLFPIPPWPDPEAPASLRHLRRSLWSKLYVYNTHDEPIPWAPGVFASLPFDRYANGPFRGGAYIVHHAVEGGLLIESSPVESADLLWSFVGSVATRPKLRGPLTSLADERSLVVDTSEWNDSIRWAWLSDREDDGRQAFASFAESLRRSRFVVCPRGAGHASMRVYEAMQAGRCPVVVSDKWMPPPLVDWDRCSIRVAEADIGKLPQILRDRDSEAPSLGRAARTVWLERFAPDRHLEFLTEACGDIAATSQTALGRAAMAAGGALTRPGVRYLRTRVTHRAHLLRNTLSKTQNPR